MTTATAPKPTKKKVKKGPTTHVSRTPEEVVAESTGQLFHGAALSMGNMKKSGREGVLSFLDLKQLQLIPDFNPRGASGPLAELAESIKADGLLQSLVVRPSKVSGKFDIIAGERRFRACKSISYERPIPCIIRSDLIGDDERALAVAMAENSEDGRSNLNLIEVGRACKKLEKKGWSIARIAKETALHSQRVRRALTLLDTPEDVQKNVREGRWSVAAGLEFARLDEPTRKAIKDKLTSISTAEDIRKYRKSAEREQMAANVASGKAPKTTKSGKPSQRPLTVWRQSREKQEVLQERCAILEAAEHDEIGSPDYHELRGSIAVLLWDRGDRTSPDAPDLKPDKNAKDYAATMKDLTAFNAVIKSEAAKYKPSETKTNKAEGDDA